MLAADPLPLFGLLAGDGYCVHHRTGGVGKGERAYRLARPLASMSLCRGSVRIEDLRAEIDQINLQILELLCQRGKLVCKIGRISSTQSGKMFDPKRKQEMLDQLMHANRGPYPDNLIVHLFKEIFKTSLNLKFAHSHLLSLRVGHPEDTVVCVKGLLLEVMFLP